jgi:hypothetical protein
VLDELLRPNITAVDIHKMVRFTSRDRSGPIGLVVRIPQPRLTGNRYKYLRLTTALVPSRLISRLILSAQPRSSGPTTACTAGRPHDQRPHPTLCLSYISDSLAMSPHLMKPFCRAVML